MLFGQQMDNTMISIYNQITNEEQHQAMLNLQLSDETISDIYTLCSNADWIEETSNAFNCWWMSDLLQI